MSTYLSSTKSACTPLLLSTETRLKIATDVTQGLPYLQDQRKLDSSKITCKSNSSTSPALPTCIRVTAQNVLLVNDNYTAKVLVMLTPAGRRESGQAINSTVNPNSNETLSHASNYHNETDLHETNHGETEEVKALGLLLLQILLNCDQEDSFAGHYPDLIANPLTCDTFFEEISQISGHPTNMLRQYCTSKGQKDLKEMYFLFVEPLFRLAMACIDQNKHNIISPSLRQILQQLWQIRKAVMDSNSTSQISKESVFVVPPETTERNVTKISSATAGRVGKKEIERKSTSFSSQKQEAELVQKNVSAKCPTSARKSTGTKTLHHPGYFYGKEYTTTDGVVVSASWRCCGKTSVKAVGCMYGYTAHHTGKWIGGLRTQHKGNQDVSNVVSWGVFDCCDPRSHDNGITDSGGRVDGEI